MRDWAHSRAVVARTVGEGEGGKGLASLRRRFPRSYVWGIGLVIVTELVESECW